MNLRLPTPTQEKKGGVNGSLAVTNPDATRMEIDSDDKLIKSTISILPAYPVPLGHLFRYPLLKVKYFLRNSHRTGA